MNDVLEDHVVNARGERLALSFHPAADVTRGASPAVIVCHGMESHRQGKVARIAEALQASGIHALRFDHGGCGDSDGDHQPVDLERRVRDLQAALAWLAAHLAPGGAVGLCGSSMGAAVSLVAASRHAAPVWAGIATPISLWPEVRDAAAAYSGRALVIWGDADEVVPPADSAWLLDHCGERTEAMRFDGGDHRLAAYVPEIADRIAAFMFGALRDVP